MLVLLSEVRFGFSGSWVGVLYFFFCRSGSDDNIMQKFPNFSVFSVGVLSSHLAPFSAGG